MITSIRVVNFKSLAAVTIPLWHFNCLPDDVAREAVQFLYKTPQGETRCRGFFSIPRMADKLNAMGPGDAFVDTDLRLLAQECIDLDERHEAAIREEEQAESDAIDSGDA